MPGFVEHLITLGGFDLFLTLLENKSQQVILKSKNITIMYLQVKIEVINQMSMINISAILRGKPLRNIDLAATLPTLILPSTGQLTAEIFSSLLSFCVGSHSEEQVHSGYCFYNFFPRYKLQKKWIL